MAVPTRLPAGRGVPPAAPRSAVAAVADGMIEMRVMRMPMNEAETGSGMPGGGGQGAGLRPEAAGLPADGGR